MIVKCGWCNEEIHYMWLTKEGLCPKCAEKARKEVNNGNCKKVQGWRLCGGTRWG